jgi:hypothetical protein
MLKSQCIAKIDTRVLNKRRKRLLAIIEIAAGEAPNDIGEIERLRRNANT